MNLPATAQIKADLKGAFIARKHIAAQDVVGTTPGSVYYAYDNSTKTYWAQAHFDLSPTASEQVMVGWQDGGGTGLFAMAADSPWSARTGGFPTYCGEVTYFPPAVLTVWGITAPSGLTC